MNATSRSGVRQHYRGAAQGFVALLQSLPPESWDKEAIGVWDVRDVTGHASRALLTVEAYLDPARITKDPQLAGPLAYFHAMRAALADPVAVAERGRHAGLALGDDPAAAVATIAARVLALVDSSDDEALVATPAGTMTVIGYLPTRTFELVVHSLDLADATGVASPRQHAEPLTACLQLAVDLTVADGHTAELLRALTGRRPLPRNFSVI